MKRIFRLLAYILLFIVLSAAFYGISCTIEKHELLIGVKAAGIGKDSPMEIFYKTVGDTDFTQERSIQIYKTDLSPIAMPDEDMTDLRIDLGSGSGEDIELDFVSYGKGSPARGYNTLYLDGKSLSLLQMNDLEQTGFENGGIKLKTIGSDPYIIINDISAAPKNGIVSPNKFYMLAAFALAFLVTFLLYRFVHIKRIAAAVKDMLAQRKLIMRLSVNDFKTRFAGSSFGVIWAFVQPVCTILVFWFVFQIGFRNPNVGDVQYILWFMTGLIPWFFFSEAWNSATNAFIEYSYLVKKVVFKINILPFIKIISALFVHLFFVVFMIVVYALYHRFPTVYYLQIIYYMFCMAALVAALSFITAPLVIFFRDISQIMSIILQFGMWLTPIMWSVDSLPRGMGGFINIFKINPMYYIVQGYRNSMIYNVPFYDNILQTVYFWVLMLVLVILGSTIYTRLKPHFADVL